MSVPHFIAAAALFNVGLICYAGGAYAFWISARTYYVKRRGLGAALYLAGTVCMGGAAYLISVAVFGGGRP